MLGSGQGITRNIKSYVIWKRYRQILFFSGRCHSCRSAQQVLGNPSISGDLIPNPSVCSLLRSYPNYFSLQNQSYYQLLPDPATSIPVNGSHFTFSDFGGMKAISPTFVVSSKLKEVSITGRLYFGQNPISLVVSGAGKDGSSAVIH